VKPPEPPAALDAGLNPVLPGTTVEQTSLGRRMEFLDALRGLAAMCVVVQHSLELLSPTWAKFSLERFRLGEYGVVVFFLCSGFIIPASIDRQGSQMRFWVGRLFRLYPLYLSMLAAVLILHYGFDKYPLPQAYLDHPVKATLVNVTMLQSFLLGPQYLALGQSWSLAYELVFYGLVSALFVVGWHTRSPLWSSIAFLLAMVVNTRHVPTEAIRQFVEHGGARVPVTAFVALAVGVGVIVWATRSSGPQRWLSIGIVAASILLVLNRPETLSLALFFFGTLFFGTCLYRWVEGDLSTGTMLAIAALGMAAIVVSWWVADIYWGLPDNVTVGSYKTAEITTYLAAYATFGLALMLRSKRFPAFILWLGTISYSLYLAHAIPIYAIGRVDGMNRVVNGLLWIGLAVAISACTYYGIERPAIRAGRKVAKRAAAPWGAPTT
jgi:peptidoglycan/LPS O-acetylase OafA/YrhL